MAATVLVQVEGIKTTGFRIDLAGGNAGTAFGDGAYFAECCSKSDEYAKDGASAINTGTYALFLCRVICGNMKSVLRTPAHI